MTALLSHKNAATEWLAANLEGPVTDAVAHMKVDPSMRLNRCSIVFLLSE